MSSSLQAKVLDADSSATTYELEHPSHAGIEYDNPYNATFVDGPWASKTFPSSPWTTGRFHWLHPEIEEEKEPWLASIDCPISKVTVLQCSKIRGFGDRRQTLAVPGKVIDGLGITFGWVPITITAGQNLLYRDAQATTTDDTSAQSTSEALGTGSTSEVVETDASSSEGAATETSQETSGVGSGAARMLSALVMTGIASAMVLS